MVLQLGYPSVRRELDPEQLAMAELAHARVFDFYLDGQGGALQGDATGAPRWVHLDRSGADMHAILDELGVPELVAQNLVSARSRPRTMMVEDGVFSGALSDGKYVKRAVPESLREAPGL